MHYLLLLAIGTLVLQPQPSAAGVGATLTVDKNVVPTIVIPGDLLTFPITATPDANSIDVLNLSISDPLPAGTRFIAASASAGATLTTPTVGATGTVTSVWDAAGGTSGGLTAAGTTRSLNIVARVCPEAGCFPFFSLTNTATASGANVSMPQMDTTTATFAPTSDLMIANDGPSHIFGGGSFTYVLTVSNAGPSISPFTSVVDTLPAGFVATNVTSTIPGARCAIEMGGQTVTCAFALGAPNQCASTPIPADGTITIDVTAAQGTTPGIHTNTATIAIVSIECSRSDPNPSNNTAAADVEVIVAPAPLLSPFGLILSLALLIGIAGLAMGRRHRPVS